MQRTRILVALLVLLSPLITYASDVNSDLIEAAKKGDAAAVKALLDKGADVNAKNNNGGTVLMFAAGNGHTATVQTLLDKGADVNARTETGTTALIAAAVEGHTDIVKLLKKAGAKEYPTELLLGIPTKYSVRQDKKSACRLFAGLLVSPAKATDARKTFLQVLRAPCI